MPDYRRMRREGGTYFFTVATAARGYPTLTENIDLLRHIYGLVLRKRPVWTDAIVILPDHFHCVWTLPAGDDDFPTRIGSIKAQFSKAVRRAGFTPPQRPPSTPKTWTGRNGGVNPALRPHKGEAGIWQRRFWEHCIRDEADYRAHMRYCWQNPVKHGLVEKAEDWPFSSIHRDIEIGTYDP